jgi:hypothetical protein
MYVRTVYYRLQGLEAGKHPLCLLTLLSQMLTAALGGPTDDRQQSEETSSSKVDSAAAAAISRPAVRSKLQKRASKLANTIGSWRSGNDQSTTAKAGREADMLPQQQRSQTPSHQHPTWLEVGNTFCLEVVRVLVRPAHWTHAARQHEDLSSANISRTCLHEGPQLGSK